MKPTIIRLSPDMLARLQSVAEATGTSVARVIRLCVTRALPQIEAHVKQQLLDKSFIDRKIEQMKGATK